MLVGAGDGVYVGVGVSGVGLRVGDAVSVRVGVRLGVDVGVNVGTGMFVGARVGLGVAVCVTCATGVQPGVTSPTDTVASVPGWAVRRSTASSVAWSRASCVASTGASVNSG